MTKEKLERMLADFTEQIRGIWQENLESVILYGSFLGEDFQMRSSDINLLIRVKDNLPDNLLRSRKIVRTFHHRIRLTPLFLPAGLWQSSLDCFAWEWHSIRNNYRVLFGNDAIRNIRVPKEALRLQIEREARENTIRFQQGLLFGLDLPALLFRSAKTLRMHLKAAAEFLPPERIPQPVHLQTIEILMSGKLKYKRRQWEELAKTHLSELNKFIPVVDREQK